ncbi:zinc finger, CCHC-type containing protein, partial [Tanacetum coccineum]
KKRGEILNNNSFLGEYKCSSLALDREERRDEKKRLDHLKQDQTHVSETEVLELIHSDLCDLHATPSLGNKKYFVTFIDDASRFCYVYLLHTQDEALDKFKVFKTEVELQQGSLIKRFRTDKGGEYMDTLIPRLFRFYVIEPNDSVSINFIIESRDAIFDENRLSSVPRPSLRISNGTEDTGGSMVPEEVTEEVVQQPEPELRKSKRNKTPKNFGSGFQLYLIEGTRDEVSDQHSYCFNVKGDPKTFDEAMKSKDVFNTPKFRTMQRNITLGCYLIAHTHLS